MEGGTHKPRNTKGGWQREVKGTAWNRSCPLRGSLALPTPCCQASGLQNCERINFCFKHLVTAASKLTQPLRSLPWPNVSLQKEGRAQVWP